MGPEAVAAEGNVTPSTGRVSRLSQCLPRLATIRADGAGGRLPMPTVEMRGDARASILTALARLA